MAVVPLELANQLEKQNPLNETNQDDGLTKTIHEFTTELSKLLNDSNKMSPEQQYQIYMQLFHRYQMLADEKRQPPTVLLKHSAEPLLPPTLSPSLPPFPSPLPPQTPLSSTNQQKNEVDWSDDYVLKGIPKNKHRQASSLLNFIKQNPRIHLNNRGELIVDNRAILGSHIIDLVHDFTCERKFSVPALGHSALAAVLKTSNVPKRYIGNPNHWNLIQQIDENFVEPISVPVLSKRNGQRTVSSSSSSVDSRFLSTDESDSNNDSKPMTSAAASFLGIKRKLKRVKKEKQSSFRYFPFM